jgi:serine/threonine protein kinase
VREVGRYTLLTKLGGGGMADVHLAVRDRSTDPKDLVALKVPRKRSPRTPSS